MGCRTGPQNTLEHFHTLHIANKFQDPAPSVPDSTNRPPASLSSFEIGSLIPTGGTNGGKYPNKKYYEPRCELEVGLIPKPDENQNCGRPHGGKTSKQTISVLGSPYEEIATSGVSGPPRREVPKPRDQLTAGLTPELDRVMDMRPSIRIAPEKRFSGSLGRDLLPVEPKSLTQPEEEETPHDEVSNVPYRRVYGVS